MATKFAAREVLVLATFKTTVPSLSNSENRESIDRRGPIHMLITERPGLARKLGLEELARSHYGGSHSRTKTFL